MKRKLAIGLGLAVLVVALTVAISSTRRLQVSQESTSTVVKTALTESGTAASTPSLEVAAKSDDVPIIFEQKPRPSDGQPKVQAATPPARFQRALDRYDQLSKGYKDYFFSTMGTGSFDWNKLKELDLALKQLVHVACEETSSFEEACLLVANYVKLYKVSQESVFDTAQREQYPPLMQVGKQLPQSALDDSPIVEYCQLQSKSGDQSMVYVNAYLVHGTGCELSLKSAPYAVTRSGGQVILTAEVLDTIRPSDTEYQPHPAEPVVLLGAIQLDAQQTGAVFAKWITRNPAILTLYVSTYEPDKGQWTTLQHEGVRKVAPWRYDGASQILTLTRIDEENGKTVDESIDVAQWARNEFAKLQPSGTLQP